MKFAKELERELVPEWRIKYMNYKAGKKYVKAVARAIKRANGTPIFRRSGEGIPPRETPSFHVPSTGPFSPRRGKSSGAGAADGEEVDPLRISPAPMGHSPAPRSNGQKAKAPKAASVAPIPIRGERQGLAKSPGNGLLYGSFVPTPPGHSPLTGLDNDQAFELPAPAIRVPSNNSEPALRLAPPRTQSLSRLALQRSASMAPSIPAGMAPSRAPTVPGLGQGEGSETPQQRLRRLLSSASVIGRGQSRTEVDLQPLDEVRARELEFFRFLDNELEKVESWYREREDHSAKRLDILRAQLHEMRSRRIAELQEQSKPKTGDAGAQESKGPENGGQRGGDHDLIHGLIDPLKAKLFKPGPNSQAFQKGPHTPQGLQPAVGSRSRDYVRRPTQDEDISYRTAKRKLKRALQEHYRGLELLKSYAILNRTAFRKLNKKYDKAVNARPPYRYMNEKVNKSYFVNSTVIDKHIQVIEDLYARYFEHGNHKLAAGKLRSLVKRPGDESPSAFRSGLMIGAGSVFSVYGIVRGAELLFDPDPLVRLNTSYLLQVYGGYFLMLYLFFLFCIDCRIWTLSRVNYRFIFEFDPRSHIDWRELTQFPSFFLLLFGLFLALNFSGLGSPDMFLYYPVILIFVTIVILFFPAPTLFHRSRKWFLYSHWRLLLAGFYPVEFRDFFLGDMYCSLTYSTCNTELFFCLYAHHWADPVQCNSNHSRLLGFFTTLPGIWRALQCIRRYKDTKDVFPHLVNCGKYAMTILSMMSLSLYRISGTHSTLVLFIFFSVANGLYTSIWDLFMDFSLLQTNSRHFLLRDILAFERRWPYYVAMILDPILRFSWIFYAIFTKDAQHNSIISFLVSFAEATRRGMWTVFRVENEHCANVAQYKAERESPLPYKLDRYTPSEGLGSPGVAEEQPAGGGGGKSTAVETAPGRSAATTPSARTGAQMGTPGRAGTAPVIEGQAEEGAAGPSTPGLLRRRRPSTPGRRNLATILAEAHKQDFEKRRKPQGSPAGGSIDEDDEGHSSDDEEEEAAGAYMAAEASGSGSGPGSALQRMFGEERAELMEAVRQSEDDEGSESPSPSR